MFDKPAKTTCKECGEEIAEGDCAFTLGGKTYCVSCVEEGFGVYRPARDDTEEGDSD